jgi:hypothetical protein
MITARLEQRSPAHTCAYSKDCAACRLPSFHTVYEVINGNDLTPHYVERKYATVAEAVSGGSALLITLWPLSMGLCGS